jgi:alkanesulfonate monooxygenase SsuD/methylene tetrahydromethanopterin reductase-like flavin-dependent oxidoreductase (luciferase family)
VFLSSGKTSRQKFWKKEEMVMSDPTVILAAQDAQALPMRERAGLAVARLDTATLVQTVIAAEAAGVRQVWSTQSALQADTLTAFAAAVVKTSTVRVGTAIVPTYPRHPLTMAAQALALNDLAPGRLRLGIGSSHRPIMEGSYGMQMGKPLEHLREYVQIVRAALWTGQVNARGKYFQVQATFPRLAQIPILISVLRENAFRLAGEIADGAISWLCPIPYLLKTGLPALRASAQAQGRPTPPLVAHVLVAMSEERSAVLQATRAQVQSYGRLPFYASMFADAGHPIGPDGSMSDELIASLVISGSSAAIAERLQELLASGLDELLVWPVPIQQAQDELHRLMQLLGGL